MGLGKKILKTSPVGYAAVKAHERLQEAKARKDTEETDSGAEELENASAETDGDAAYARPAPFLAPGGAFPQEVSTERDAAETPESVELDDGEEEWDGDLHKKARQALDENLAEGEEVRVILNMGRRSRRAAIIATDRRLFVFKTGMASGATFGSKFSSFDYRNVSGISLHTGAMTGSAVIDVAGAAPVGSSYWGNRNNDPWKAQNAIPVTRPYDDAKKQIAAIRQLITDWHDRASAPQGGALQGQTGDVVDQIKRLGELRDAGLITAEEFGAKKAELLDRL